MPSYTYTARETVSGREIRNAVEAASEQAAIAALLNRNLLVVSIQEKVSKKGKTKGGKIALADLVIFTRQLATMVDAGITIVASWRVKITRSARANKQQTKSCATPFTTFMCAWKAVKAFLKPFKNTRKRSPNCTSPWWAPAKKAVCWLKF